MTGKIGIGVLVSGGGSNFEALARAAAEGRLAGGEIRLLVSPKPGVGALERARRWGVEAVVLDPRDFPTRGAYYERVGDEFSRRGVRLVCLAGFLLKVEKNFIDRYRGRILNIHPALLPKFGGAGMYGRRVHQAVLAAGEKESGCTVHLVDEEFDHGPVLSQARVPVLPGDTPDTLAARVLEQEHKIFPEAVRQVVAALVRPDTLYLFIDESGNFDFSPNGTRYFILTVLSTTDPFVVGGPLLRLRYDLLPNYACGDNGEEEGYFHAAEDIQSVRSQVFETLRVGRDSIRVDAVIAQKNKANPVFHRQPVDLYKAMGTTVLQFAFNRADWHGFRHVVVVFSSLFDRKKRGILKQTFKSVMKERGIPFSLYFHGSKFDICSQAVDYMGWAVYRKWEKEDTRSYEIVKEMVRSEFLIFERGGIDYYAYKK